MLPVGGLFAGAAGGPQQPGSCNAGQEMILGRLDRLEEICSRIESYMRMVLGTLDRRLQMLEADALSARRVSTQDSMTSPRFPTASGAGFSCEAGTLVTPEMLMMVQSPRPDRVPLFAAAGLPLEVPFPISVPTEAEAATECLSPIEDEDALPTPVLIPLVTTTATITTAAEPLPDVPSPPVEDPFQGREDEHETGLGLGLGLGLDEVSASTITLAPFFAAREREIEERQKQEDDEAAVEDVSGGSSNAQVSAIAIFSLAPPDAAVGHENPMDALLCEPVLSWENDGFPYLRPAYQLPRGRDLLEPLLRDATVLTWEAATYLSPESAAAGNEDDRATSHSSEEDEYSSFFTTTHVDDLEEVAAARLQQRQQQHEIQRKEDSMLAEISSILQNICSNLESLKTPELGTASSSSGSWPHCRHESAAEEAGTTAGLEQRPVAPETVANPKEQEELLSVIEGMFRKLAFSPRAEDVLVSILPGGEASSRSAAAGDMRMDVEEGSSACSSSSHYHYAELPQHDEDEEIGSGKAKEGTFQCFPLDAGGKVYLPGVHRPAAPGGEENQEKKERVATVVFQKIGGDSKQMVVTTPLRACCSAAAHQGSLEDYLAAVGNEEKEHEVDRPMAFNWEGIPASGECEDIPCLLKVEDRKVAGKDEVASVGQEVCLSMDIPGTYTAAERSTRGVDAGAGADVHIGISLKPVAATRAGDEGTNAISCVEIPEEKPFEKVPFTEMAPLPQRPSAAAKEELEPLKNAAVPEQKTPLLIIDNKCLAIEELVDSILAPPPSPVDEAEAEAENLPTMPTPVEAAPPPETHDYLFKEEEEKKSGTLENEWVIDTVFLPKDNFQQVEAKVPKPVLKGMTPVDLIRGSLHFDGKACLLSISIDDIWSTEDMCHAPASAAAALAKQKSLLDTLCADKSISGFGAFVKQQDESMNKKKQQQGFGFRQLKPKPAQAAAASFGFRSQGKQLSPAKSLEHLQPLVTTLPETAVRAPDSPAARSCIIDGDPTESPSPPAAAAAEPPVTKQLGIAAASTSTSTPVESDQEQEEQATPPLPAPVVEGGGSAGEEEIAETQGWSFPLDASGGAHESETFFDALQCSAAAARNGSNKKFKRYLKDKLWSRLACYGFGLPESEASDAPCHHDTRSM